MTTPVSRWRRYRVPALLVLAGVVSILVAAAAWTARSTTVAGHATPIVQRGTLSHRPDPASPSTALVHHVMPVGSRLSYPRLGIAAPVVPVTAQDGAIDVPRNPRLTGWWSGGAGPGDTSGSVVVVGHINYGGTAGALGVLPDARPGDTVSVLEPGRPALVYRVEAVRTYPKTRGIPAAAFETTGAPRLVLITCGGPFDAATGNYEDNVVVYAAQD